MNQHPEIQPHITRRMMLGAVLGGGVIGLTACSPFAQRMGINTHSELNAPDGLPNIVPDTYDPQLPLLKKYEIKAGVANRMMKFIGYPEDSSDAEDLAAIMAGTLQEWHNHDAHPIIMMEPTIEGGTGLMDLHSLQKEKSKMTLDTYFKSLRRYGITDEQMGMWVPLPEPNIPRWKDGVTDPELFAKNVTTTAHALKQNFPATPVSVLLDSRTYPTNNNWIDSTTDPTALLPYLTIESGLVDSFGLEGFSWTPSDEAAVYLNAASAIAGARRLKINHAWFNSGTNSIANAPGNLGIIKSSNGQRHQVMSQILEQVIAAKHMGLTVDFLNIFGKNTFKAHQHATAEYQYDTPEAVALLKHASEIMNRYNVALTLYDSAA